MPFINFPDLPAVIGVPQIPRLPDAGTLVQAGLGIVEGALWNTASSSGSQWGIFDKSGKPLGDPGKTSGILGGALSSLGVPDALLTAAGLGGAVASNYSTDYTKETQVSTFPVEKGSFAAYNKVQNPGTPTVVLCFTGTAKEGTAFLKAIDDACKSTDLYDVVTPTATYKKHSIEKYNYSRTTQKGAALLYVQLMLKEIREVSSQYTNTATSGGVLPGNPLSSVIGEVTKSVSSAIGIDAGKIQAAVPNVSILKSGVDKIGSFIKNPLGALGF